MKITPSFTHPQAILGVYDFLLSDEHNRSYINKYPDASELYNGSERDGKVLPSTSIYLTSYEVKYLASVFNLGRLFS